MNVEERLNGWADWILTASGDLPKFDPSLGYSLGDSTVGQPHHFAGTGGQGGALTAQGKQTPSYRSGAPGEPPEGWWTVSEAVNALKVHTLPRDKHCGERAWAVLMARYLGWVPRRRDRIRRDEHGVHLARERLPRGRFELKDSYDERLRQRLFVSRATFHNRLARAQDFVAAYCDAVERNSKRASV